MENGPHENRTPSPLPGNALQWNESNCALAGLITRYRRFLKAAMATAAEINRGIDELEPLMGGLCRRTCRFCPEPCCITNTVWFDFRDLLFFHLREVPIPARQAVSDPNEACPFLSHCGCRLLPRTRPWMCIQYLCPAQRAVIAKKGGAVAYLLQEQIATIGEQRARMEAEVVCCIRHRKKEISPSDHLARGQANWHVSASSGVGPAQQRFRNASQR